MIGKRVLSVIRQFQLNSIHLSETKYSTNEVNPHLLGFIKNAAFFNHLLSFPVSLTPISYYPSFNSQIYNNEDVRKVRKKIK